MYILFCLPDKHLRPEIAARCIAHAYLSKGRIQDIPAVTVRIHPSVHDALRRTVAVGDVLAGGAVAYAEALHHIER